MPDTRHRNKNWNLGEQHPSGPTFDQVKCALLMDIRDELQALNRLLNCSRFIQIPTTLSNIERAVSAPKVKRAYVRKKPLES